MNAGSEPHVPQKFEEVTAIRSREAALSGNWHCDIIYRWHGQAIEIWHGPSSDPATRLHSACQLRSGANEIGFLDLGKTKTLNSPHAASQHPRNDENGHEAHFRTRKTGTVLGELISFEQHNPGLFPHQRSIDIRLEVKQCLTLKRRWSHSYLIREDLTSVAKFTDSKLFLTPNASRSESTAAMLIACSGLLRFLDSPLLTPFRKPMG